MIEHISKSDFLNMALKYHYSKTMPKLNKIYLGDKELSAVISLGWGVRPQHTIKRLFPSLSTDDYFEIGKMCLSDEMPRNSESVFLSRVIKWLKENKPNCKVLFTWADGMVGKAGYVYQSANFMYGGYIWTDTYFTNEGEKIHPRMTGKIGGRPNDEFLTNNEWKHYKGKQFRYIYLLCGHKERKRLLAESEFNWANENYPKEDSIEWKVKTENGWESVKSTPFDKNANGFSEGINKSILISKQKSLFGSLDDAEEVSRVKHNISNVEGLVQFQHSAPQLHQA